MKNLFLNFLIIILILTFPLSSLKSENFFSFGGGVYCGYKGVYNTSSTQGGIKSGFAFNPLPEIGGSLDLLFKGNTGIIVDFGLTTNSIKAKNDAVLPGEINQSVLTEYHKYFTINPHIYLFGLTFGCNFGLPLKSSLEFQSGNPQIPKQTVPINTDLLSTLTEIHLGGKFKMTDTGILGKLYIFFDFTYALTGIYSDYVKNNPLIGYLGNSSIVQNSNNPKPIAFTLGLNYMFNILSF